MISETLCYSDYKIHETKDSQIDVGKTIEVEVGFRCPHCKMELLKLEHGKYRECPKCRLQMQLFGNGLHCIKEV